MLRGFSTLGDSPSPGLVLCAGFMVHGFVGFDVRRVTQISKYYNYNQIDFQGRSKSLRVWEMNVAFATKKEASQNLVPFSRVPTDCNKYGDKLVGTPSFGKYEENRRLEAMGPQ